MKKVMILGGSENQIPLLKKSKELNYSVVLCDYSRENIGIKYADRFYCVSTLDKEAILEVARKEKIDGIITNSEPAMSVSSFVGNQLGLPSNPYDSIIILSRKDKFRKFLRTNGFNSPLSYMSNNYEDASKNISKFRFPLIIKPNDSSGSRGVARIDKLDEFKKTFEMAIQFSKSRNVIVEEFIERTHDYMIGGDIFVQNGEVVFWGLMNSMRNFAVNEFVPVGTSFPTLITEKQFEVIKESIGRMLKLLNIKFGPFNVELMFDNNNKLYAIEINPRSGGNRIPEILNCATGVDTIKCNIKASLNEENIKIPSNNIKKYISTYIMHAAKPGILKNIKYNDSISNNIVKIIETKNIGERVEKFNNADKLLGIVFLKFSDLEEMKSKLERINEFIKIEVNEN